MQDLLLLCATEAVKLLFAILTLAVAVFLPLLLYRFLRWAGVKEEHARLIVDRATEEADRLKIRNLLLGVEEWAATKIKAGDTMTAQLKMEKYLEDASRELPHILSDVAIQYAQEELPKLGLGAAGDLHARPPVAAAQ